MNLVLRRILIATTLIALGIAGCRSTYYSMWQELGYEKRDILVSRVEKARDDQTAAKQQFKSTMDQFKELTNFKGGDLEAEYNKINASYNECQARATAVTKRIDSVDKVATDMFTEWANELNEYHDPSLRASSQQKLDEAKKNYALLLAMMRRSEAKMQPVLDKFHDQVLFLKHNLNAEAISSLSGTSVQIDADVQSLLKDMDASINESNAFIDNLKKS